MSPNLELPVAEASVEIIPQTESAANTLPSLSDERERASFDKTEAMRSLREGIAASKAGNRAEARYFLLEAVRLDSGNETAWLWLASISEQPVELYEFLQKVLEINPENARALEWSRSTKSMIINSALSRGAAFSQENNRAAAAECFRQALDYEANHETAWLWLAFVTEELEDKLSYLQRVLDLNPKNEKALSLFHAAKRQMARNLLKKGNLAAVSGDRATARQILCDVMEYDSGLEEAWLLRAFLSDSIEEKTESFRKTLEINPENAQAASGMASLQAMQEEEPALEEARENSEQVFQESMYCPFCAQTNSAATPRCYSCKAFLTLDNAEDFMIQDSLDDGTLRTYIERLTVEQTLRELSTEEHLNLGYAYLNLKNFKKGATHFERAVEITPEDRHLKAKVAGWIAKLQQVAPELMNGSNDSGKTIMVVDDSPTVRKLIVGKLEKHGHRVVPAIDGIDALSKLNEEKPDLILLDVTMPRLDGYQLCKHIKQTAATKHIPVVMISGKDGFFDKVRGRMAGSTAYITKPFGPETLLQTVETYCK